MKVAVIDLGTNTFNLTIAEVSKTSMDIIYSDKEGVGLGMGGINENRIHEDAMNRAVETLKRFKTVCDSWKVEIVKLLGTSAIRDASNQIDFLKKVKTEIGFDVLVVSGKEEAISIYNGVNWNHSFDGTSLIMDIGGGSTEFIFVENGKVSIFDSTDIGLSRLIQSRIFQDPLSEEDISFATSWYKTRSIELLKQVESDVLIGASGSFETLYELIYETEFPSSMNSIEMSLIDVLAKCDFLIHSKLEERNQNPFIIPIRRKMAPLAAVLIKYVIELKQIKRVFVSPCSMKEGVLVGMI